jgi:predicted  nucleic acid-binding Zn-ribbon protein
MDLLLLVLVLVLALFLIYQTKVLRGSSREKLELEKRLSDIENGLDFDIEKKRETLKSLQVEIDSLKDREAYIKADQVELNKEYEYLKERNRSLEQSIISIEEMITREPNV